MITGIARIRNESLILEDTLSHYFKFCEKIVIYDDASTDNSVDIALGFDNVTIVQGHTWQPINETNHRAQCMGHVETPWIYCFDADERVASPLPNLDEADGFRLKLFDAYLTPDKQSPYERGLLENLPRMYGPERRDILMLFKKDLFSWGGDLQREPHSNLARIKTANTFVKHFGKALSIEHWESNCDYYETYFPEPYTTKWKNRHGKAIHTESDFGEPLYSWEDVIKTDVPMRY